MTTLRAITETAGDLSREVKDSVADFGRTAGRKIHGAQHQTGGALHAAACSVRRSSAKIDNLAGGAARRLDATASFVEHASLKGFFTGLRRFGQNHLTAAMLAGAAIGFWAGSALGRAVQSDRRPLETTK